MQNAQPVIAKSAQSGDYLTIILQIIVWISVDCPHALTARMYCGMKSLYQDTALIYILAGTSMSELSSISMVLV